MRIIPNHQNVRPLGRTHDLANALWLCYSGSGAEFAVSGTYVAITFAADDRGIAMGEPVRMAVYADDVRAADLLLDEPEKAVRLPLNGESVIRIVKLSESAMSTCGVRCIETDGDIRPTAPRVRRIEFIGDSITCGYGVDDPDRLHHFQTKTEDVTRAYAWRTAESLQADWSMVALSGWGIYSGCTATAEEPITDCCIPLYYDRVAFSYGSFDGQTPADVSWDFEAFQPDVVVINLGTNDDSYTRDDPLRQDKYQAAYTAFLYEVRRRNPQAHILCTLGMMGLRLYPRIEAAVEDYVRHTGDGRISCMPFAPQREEDGYAADYHPSPATHAIAADRLSCHLKQLMGW